MRIGLIGVSLFAQGAEYVLASLARGFAAHGHEVDVIVSQIHADKMRSGKIKPFDVGDNVNIHVLKSRRARWSVLELRSLYKNRKYEVVMSHASPYAIPMALAAIGLRNPPKTISVQHNGGAGTDLYGRKIEPSRSFMDRCKNKIRELIDALFVVSAGAAEAEHRMSGYPSDKIFTVYNPVVDDLFNKKKNDNPSHSWLQKDQVVPVVVAAGAFADVKNFPLLIRAFAKVRKECPCRLVIFGEGSNRAAYEALVHDLGVETDVSLPGFTNNLPAELKGASCFVVSSYVESFSIVLVEALACGVPVVAVDCPHGPRGILEDGKNGILVENNNVNALAEGIRQVLLGKGIHPTPSMVSRFTTDVVVRHYEEVLCEMMSYTN